MVVYEIEIPYEEKLFDELMKSFGNFFKGIDIEHGNKMIFSFDNNKNGKEIDNLINTLKEKNVNFHMFIYYFVDE